jgi:hypothetical protein
MLPSTDTDFEIPVFDEVIELGIDDGDYGEPQLWPSWTDRFIWELGPDRPGEDVPLVDPPDELPALAFEPSEEDRADQARWAE